MTSSRTPGVAVVGCGQWGRNLVRTFHSLGALLWLCDSDASALDRQARLTPGVRTTTRFDEVLDADVEAIVLATPAALHFAGARAALRAGKDVFVEKPLALRYHEGCELLELADSLDRVLMVGHILQYHPAVERLRELVAGDELGRLWYIYSNRLNLGKVRPEENILWSFAPHDISVIHSLVGAEPETVSAIGSTYLQSGIADTTVTNLRFPNGVGAHIFVSWLHPYKEQRLVVVGERKMAVFDDTRPTGKLRIHDKGFHWADGVPVPRNEAEAVLEIAGTEPLRLECEHFLTCVSQRTTPLTDGVSALSVLRVLEASQRSMDHGGSPVSVSDITAPARV
ncbi:MAG TPA: Gfo/Idh/MocA family oxidoreductase [Vicinamibacterales bacterium]|nr:Gfo/Idh/MocA family oxidoreductase [Vicinamibacterales bacterium]